MTDDELHARIMNIVCRIRRDELRDVEPWFAYREGHRDARHAAAELVATSASARDSEVERLREALEAARDLIYGKGWKGYEEEKAKVDAALSSQVKEPGNV